MAAFFSAAIDARLAVALWRHPGSEIGQGIVDLSGSAQPTAIDFRSIEPSFIFSPFHNEAGNQPLRLRADVRLTPDGLHVEHGFWNGQRQRLESFFASYQSRLQGAPSTPAGWYVAPQTEALHSSSYDEYCRLVDQAIEFIVDSGLKKIVVSRTTAAPLPPGFDPHAVFQALCRRYPAAFVSLVSIPNAGTWIGASPELLLSIDRRSLHTMALAGTQARPAHAPETTVCWSDKEIEEQALVSDYIRDFFKRAGVQPIRETGPRATAAGNVVHLRSDFCVELPQAELMALANRVLYELHPTSAVCGMPKDKALAFILAHEGYDRSFYSGYLGPVHLDGQSHLYVNLRCMQLGRYTAHLYVGGGVTADSRPEAEWRETELKAGTLLAVLQSYGAALHSPQPTPALVAA